MDTNTHTEEDHVVMKAEMEAVHQPARNTKVASGPRSWREAWDGFSLSFCRNQPCRCPDLGLPACRTGRE